MLSVSLTKTFPSFLPYLAGVDQVDNLDTAMAILAKVAIGGAWIIMYTYTNELYPTVVR